MKQLDKSDLLTIFIYLILLGRFDNPDNLDADTMAKEAFEQMDYLKNDIITKDEFMRACMGSDKIITMLAYRMLDVCMTDCG